MSFYEDVQGALLVVDSRHQGAHRVRHEVVDLDGDATAARFVHERRGLLDRLRTVHLGWLGLRGATGDVHGGSGRAELYGDPASRSAGGSGHERHLAGKGFQHPFSLFL